MQSEDDDSTNTSEQVYIKHVKSEKKKSKRKLVETNEERKPGLLNIRNPTLDNFLEARKHIKSIRDKSTTQHINISTDEELWFLQCPKNIDVDDLLGRKLVLSQPVQLIQSKGGNKEFECKLESSKHVSHLTVICPTNGVPEAVSVKQAGMITIRERIEVSQQRNYANSDTNSNSTDQLFKYPTNLKIRHPLLGVNFDNIEIKEEEDDIEMPSPKKKLKHGQNSNEGIEIKQEPDEEFFVSKKEKKRKKIQQDVIDDDIIIKQEPSEVKKHSKKRRHCDDFDVVNIKIEDTTPTKHKRKIKSEPM